MPYAVMIDIEKQDAVLLMRFSPKAKLVWRCPGCDRAYKELDTYVNDCCRAAAEMEHKRV